MIDRSISSGIKEFVFRHIDSVELLDALLYLRSKPTDFIASKAISDHLRTNPVSVEMRLNYLEKVGIVEKQTNDAIAYRYAPKDPVTAHLIDELAVCYKTRRYSIFELIFSPLRKANSFAAAFVVENHNKK